MLSNCGYCCCPSFLSTAQQSKVPCYMLNPFQIYNLIINQVNKYNIEAISFNDDNFLIGNKKGIQRAIEFCEIIISAKKLKMIPKDIKFSCQTRATDFLTNNNVNYKII